MRPKILSTIQNVRDMLSRIPNPRISLMNCFLFFFKTRWSFTIEIKTILELFNFTKNDPLQILQKKIRHFS